VVRIFRIWTGRAGKCPAAPAAPLPGNFSQKLLAGNIFVSRRKFFFHNLF
jgi:hypothetical protein